MENIIQEQHPGMVYNPSLIYDPLSKMTFYGDYKTFFDKFQEHIVSQLSNIDLKYFSEKNIKFLLLSIFFQNNFHLPYSETENSKGYTDIYLERRNYLYPKITTDWVWELKYIKQADAKNESVIEAKKTAALEQLQRYKTSNRFRDRKDVRYLMILFFGKKEHLVDEVFTC
jgi:hypothetical protein